MEATLSNKIAARLAGYVVMRRDIPGYQLLHTFRPSCDLDLISVSQRPLDSSADVNALSRSTVMCYYCEVMIRRDGLVY